MHVTLMVMALMGGEAVLGKTDGPIFSDSESDDSVIVVSVWKRASNGRTINNEVWIDGRWSETFQLLYKAR